MVLVIGGQLQQKYTVLIPAYNEEKAILETIEGVKGAVDDSYEILVIDDGSMDRTYELAKSCGVRVIRHETNKGKATALKTGVENAIGGIIATIDADCTYEAAKIPDCIRAVEQGADLAIGSRFLGQSRTMGILNRIGNRIFSSLISFFTGQRITDAQTGLRAFRKELFYRLPTRAKGLDWETEMTARAVKEGYIVKEIPTKYEERVGESKLDPFADGYRMLKAVFKGTRPLSELRRFLVRRIMSQHIKPNAKVLYLGWDGGDLVSHLVGSNTIHYMGEPISPIPKGVGWVEKADIDYDHIVITHLQDVVDDLGQLKFAYEHLKKGGKLLIWLSNPNAHAILSWLMILKLIGKVWHIRYYSGNIQKILKHIGFEPELYKRCNLHINILVTGKKI